MLASVAWNPTALDLAVCRALAHLLGKWQLADLGVESLIAHNILGGFWYAAVMFIAWTRPRRGGRAEVFTTLLASLLAVLIALVLGAFVRRTPPYLDPQTAALFPLYLTGSTSQNCFPSMSTALYSAVAAGAMRSEPVFGVVLWIWIPLLVAAPRMYVGGHFLTDVLAGLACGCAGYALARFLGGRVSAWAARWAEATSLHLRLASFVVFVWILELAIEFKEGRWLRDVAHRLLQ